jgi:hypothetical protein
MEIVMAMTMIEMLMMMIEMLLMMIELKQLMLSEKMALALVLALGSRGAGGALPGSGHQVQRQAIPTLFPLDGRVPPQKDCACIRFHHHPPRLPRSPTDGTAAPPPRLPRCDSSRVILMMMIRRACRVSLRDDHPPRDPAQAMSRGDQQRCARTPCVDRLLEDARAGHASMTCRWPCKKKFYKKCGFIFLCVVFFFFFFFLVFL